ncbi:amino acid adenylation domain-containing protein [Umezawaea sp. NPDC059074]|uniref:amino acid adenylation domain-containing protein n=1 Tax=Umezawaea sp. NPDC059074 TaxID=3346716 RepID=UPI0036BEBCA1
MYELFTARVERSPERVAVRDQSGSLSYSQLSRRVAALADLITARVRAPGARVGLHLDRTADVVTAVLAVVSAGHAYVPLDPHYPADRLEFMAEDSRLALIVSDRDLPDNLADVPVVRWSRDTADVGNASVPATTGEPDPESVAYVIYTSGSTGRPKGVQVSRRSVKAMVTAVRARYDFTADDVWTLFHSYSFDFSVWEMWGALATGACLVVVPASTAASPRATAELLVRERVTVLSVVPSVFRYLTALVSTTDVRPAEVRRVIFGGESIDVADVRSWRESVNADCQFVNTYGITETTVFVSTRTLLPAEIDQSADRGFATDLGQPLDGWEIAVLGADDRPVDRGETGEICVAGAGVALGYLHRRDLTEERFTVLDLPGGGPRRFYRSGDLATRTRTDVLRYAGRTDEQVKVNGFRIELGEVEAVLRGVPGVGDVAVLCGRSRIGEPMLTAYYAAGTDLRTALVDRVTSVLPKHMAPSRFVRLDEFPLNPSGKTDRRALGRLS